MTATIRLSHVGLVAIGGAAGSLLRFGVARLVGEPAATGGVPVATLAVNLLGACLLGVLTECAARHEPGDRRWTAARLALGTGLLGGFTTYSLLANDAATMLLAGQAGAAIAYAAVTLLGGVIASFLGILAGAGVSRRIDRTAAGGGS